MKKWISLLLVLALSLGCVGFAAAEETRTFTDSTGRTVEVPANITRIAISGPMTQIIVFALAPDKLVGISSSWDPEAKPFISEEAYNLPLLGQLYGGKGEMNLEELLASDAQVVIDIGESKGSVKEDMDSLSEQTGIPFVHIEASLPTFGDAYEMLGELLGMEEEAAVLADYCRSVYERALDISEKVEKKNLLYITGAEGHNVIAANSYHSEVIDLLSNNLAVVDSPSSRGTGNEVDMEQILNWNPDFVIFAPESIYATVAEDEAWSSVTAIANGNYIEVPNGPYNWMGFPPSVQRLLGVIWMAKALYPETADYDLYTEVAQYFDLFYHCDLTQEAFDELVANSLL